MLTLFAAVACGMTAAPANPAVEPGKVRWHATVIDACTAAQKSSKPVLVLHMMGRLDRQFC